MVAVEVQYRHEAHSLVSRDEQSQIQPPPPAQNRPSSASDSPNATIPRIKEMNQRKLECVLEGVLRPQRNAKAEYTSTAAFRTSLSTFHSTPPLTTVLRVPYYLHSPQCSLYSKLLAVDSQHEHEIKAARHICSSSPQGIRFPICKPRLLILTTSFENACYNELSQEMYALPRNIVRFCEVHCTTMRVEEGCVSNSIFCR